MPGVHDLLLRVTGESSSATRTLAEVAAELNAIDREDASAKVTIDDGVARTALNYLEERLDKIGATTRSPTIEANVANARVDLARIRHELDAIGREKATAQVDVDIAGALAKLELLKKEINSTQRAGGRGGGGGGGFDPLGLAPGGRPANLFSSRTLTSLLLASLPLMPTVGASFAGGAVGAGALGLAGGGAGAVGFGSVLPVALAGLKNLGTALSAYDTQQKNAGINAVQMAAQQLQAAASQTQAAEQVQAATTNLSRARVVGDQQVADAERTLSRTEVAAHQATMNAERQLEGAQQSERFAQQALNLARRQAVRDLEDMKNAALESGTAEQQARLNLEKAREALATAPADTPFLDLAQLRLDVKEAEQALHDAGVARDRAEADNRRAQRGGVAGQPGVVSARRALTQAQNQAAQAAKNLANVEKSSSEQIGDATRALARTRVSANQQVADAERQLKQATEAQTLATKQAALAAKSAAMQNNTFGKALRLLPPSGRDVARMLIDLRTKLRRTPASDTFFATIGDGIKAVNRQWPEFKRVSGAAMSAIRASFDDFLQRTQSPAFLKFVDTMTVTFIKGLPPLERAFSNIGEVLGRIAEAAAPELIKMLNRFADRTDVWVKHTKNAKDLHHTVHNFIVDFRVWMRLLGAFGRLLGSIFLTNERGAKNGREAIRDLIHTLDGWTKWIETHHHEVNQFFNTLLNTLGEIFHTAGNFLRAFAPISKAFIPVANAIHSIVSDLNSLKIGNVSVLTLLLGGIALGKAGSLLKKIPGVSRLLGPAAGGGVTAAEGAAAGGGGAAGAGGLRGLLGRIPLSDAAESSLRFGSGAGAGAAVIFQSLFGKPGSFLGPGIAGNVPGPGDAKKAIRADRELLRNISTLTITQLRTLRDKVQGQWALMLEEDPAKAASQGQKKLSKIAHETAHQLNQAIRGSHLGTAFADSVAEDPQRLPKILAGIRGEFTHMNRQLQDDYIAATKKRLDLLRHEGLISQQTEDKALKGLEDLQHKSFQRQRDKFQDLSKSIVKTIGGGFASLLPLVNSVFGGGKGITGMVNQLLTGVSSTKKLKWNATTAGTVAANLAGLAGQIFARGGEVDRHPGGPVSGRWGGDDRIIAVGGEEHVIRASQAKKHRPLLDAINRGLVPGYARGGKAQQYALPWPGGLSAATEYDRGIDVGGTGPVFAMDSGVVTKPSFNLFTSYGSSTSGLVMRMDHPPSGFSPSSPYLYIYELFNPEGAGRHGGRVRAGELLGHIMGGTGIEMGWSTSSGVPLADSLGEDIAARHSLPRGLPTSISLQNFIAAIQGGAHIASSGLAGALELLPKIKIGGPDGMLKSIAQGAADMGRRAANAYLRRTEPSATRGGASGTGIQRVKSLPGGWKRVGATYEGLTGQKGSAGVPVGTGFAELLVQGANINRWHEDLAALLGYPNKPQYGMPDFTRVLVRKPGSKKALSIPKTDVGSGQPSSYYKIDLQQHVLEALGTGLVTQDVEVKHAARGLRNALGGLSLVGETGPELRYVPTGGSVYAAGETERILNGLASGAMALAAPRVRASAAVGATGTDGGVTYAEPHYHLEVPGGEAPLDPVATAARLALIQRQRRDF